MVSASPFWPVHVNYLSPPHQVRMADQVAAKRALQELIKREELKNKVCCDCSNLNPQWASLSFAVFLCLQCAGTHRGFGVHISFVRSVSMDTWQDEQIRRMQLGGNAPFREFMRSYSPAEQGGYSDTLSPYNTYHCWAATQYREKLDATLAGKEWSPSSPPEGTPSLDNSSASPLSSSQGLRKSRASARSAIGSSLRTDSASPASLSNSRQGTPDPSLDQKTANESFFSGLGQANASRPADLPPSQGGRYQGFGNTPSPSPSHHPSYRMSSASAPTMGEIQENPVAALSKGWSLFSAAVAGASRAVSENVIQPGMEKVKDPNLHASVAGYLSEAQKRAQAVGQNANHWTKNQFGVDVAEQVGGVVGTVKDKMGAGPSKLGYGSLPMEHEEGSALYHDDDDNFFGEFSEGNHHGQQSFYDQPEQHSTSKTPAAPPASKKDDFDEWQDF